MASTHPTTPMGRRDRRIERASWVPTLGPGMVLGAIATVGLIVAMFMSWRSGAVHPSDVPVAFLFDHTTTASDPSILLLLIPMAVLLGVGTTLPRAGAARLIGGLGTIVVVTLFGVQLQQTLDEIPGANLGDVLQTGFYVAAIAGLLGVVSSLLPSGWSERRWSGTDSTLRDRQDQVVTYGPRRLTQARRVCRQLEAGWNSSTTLPDGSWSRICLPPGPSTMSLRNVAPASRSRATSASMSSTMKWMRFQPPGPGWTPSGIGRPAELVGPASSSRRFPP